jgi:hypothetical protein
MNPYTLTYMKATSKWTPTQPPVYVSATARVTGDANIPPPPATGALVAKETRLYTLTLRPLNRQLNPALVERAGEGPGMRLQVWTPPTTFMIELDSQFSWFFDDPAVTLKTIDSSPVPQSYSNLRVTKHDDAGNPVGVAFDAADSGLPLGSVDFCFLNVVFNQSLSDGSMARIFLKIDPTIPNPGDDPGHP